MRDETCKRKLVPIRDVSDSNLGQITENIIEIVRGFASSLKINSVTLPQITSRLILVTKFVIHNSRIQFIEI